MLPRLSSVEQSLETLLSSLPSAGSQRVYAGAWERFEAWLGSEQIAVLAARPRDVTAYLAKLRSEKKAKSTIGHGLSVIREAYSAFVRDELIAINPAREVKAPKMSSNPRTPWLNEEQVRAVFFALRGDSWKERRARMCAVLLFGIGWRRSEVARMRLEDFNYTDQTVTGIIKGAKRITVGVPPWVLSEIKMWARFARIPKGALLPRSEEDPAAISGDVLYNIVRASTASAGHRVSPHAFRRTFITITGKRGYSLRKRQLAVGHESQQTTEGYDLATEATDSAPGEVLADLVGERTNGP